MVDQEPALARVPRALAFRYDILPLALADGSLTIALPDVDDEQTLAAVRQATRLKLVPVTMPREHIRVRLIEAYGSDGAGPLGRTADTPAVRRVSAMFERAVSAHASDIHLEPQPTGGRVRLRIDGVLRQLETLPPEYFPAVISRIKVLAGMDIADKRQPQDGRLTIACEGRSIDARVASMPTIDGEKLVIRLLDRHTQTCEIAALGMPDSMLGAYREQIRRPWGFVVVTGPTGSGKTTTLYASLADIDAATKNVCSVEDPIEMRVAGVTQVGVNARAGVTFASALRGFLRHDPDVIMVGEMRDSETAAVAVAAALAGQLVYTTMHANDAPRTIERFVELGVARGSLAAGLSAILAQRLVRRLCPDCRRRVDIPATERAQLDIAETTWWTAVGCRACDGVGYSGRIGVYELLVVDDAIRDAIGRGASSVALAALAAEGGYRPMIVDGLAKVVRGETSYAELARVVDAGSPR